MLATPVGDGSVIEAELLELPPDAGVRGAGQLLHSKFFPERRHNFWRTRNVTLQVSENGRVEQ
jgi:hypothetical protein